MNSPGKVIDVLASELGLSRDSVREKVEKVSSMERIASNVDKETGDRIREYGLAGVKVDEDYKRYYPFGSLASKVLGFTGSDNQGIIGLEVQYDQILQGTPGKILTLTDARGIELPEAGESRLEPVPGDDLQISLDYNIQSYIEQEARRLLEQKGADSVSIIIMNPQNGEILGMTNTPEFDLNDPFTLPEEIEGTEEEALNQMWRNGCINDTYEPGSTFKLVTAASALDSGSANRKSRYKCPGYIVVNGTKINCWGTAHGTESLKQAVGNSCNPAMARVALNMGSKRFYDYIDLFGFDDKTGIDLPGEGNSIVKNPTNLGDVDLATTGFGQGIAITPIQLMCAINALGNDGNLMKPKVVQKILDSDGKTVRTIKDTKVRKVVSTEVADKMREIMQYYVEKGGGGAAYIPGYRIGGKTGTANIASNGGYSHDTVASFIAMAPMDDPQVTVLVMVTRPKGSEFGAVNAGPIVNGLVRCTSVSGRQQEIRQE